MNTLSNLPDPPAGETPEQIKWRPCGGVGCHYVVGAPATHCAKHGSGCVVQRELSYEELKAQLTALTQTVDQDRQTIAALREEITRLTNEKNLGS